MTPGARVLVVDDDGHFRRVLSNELKEMGCSVRAVASGAEGMEEVERESYDVVLLDIRMAGMDGIEVLKRMKEVSPWTEVVMLTAYSTVDSAIRSMKLGAYDYLTKPCPLDVLEATIGRAYEKTSLSQQNAVLKEALVRKDRFSAIIGVSSGLRSVLDLVEKVAATDSTVLIQGESGVGKELVARAIHAYSARRDQPFVVIDCGTLQEALLESELFGHERGAYTGAVRLKHGLFEVANSGTIFMDEIGEVSSRIQSKLLRALETGSFRRVGGTKDITVDVRVIVATNRDLRRETEEERFREDLYYRLNVVTVTVPPLRERTEDIPLLVRYFLERFGGSGKRKGISESALDRLMKYHWPGNVRELENLIERAVILSDGDVITPDDLPGNLSHVPDSFVDVGSGTLPTLRELEGRYIRWVMDYTDGHRNRASEILGIDPKTLYRKWKEMMGDRA